MDLLFHFTEHSFNFKAMRIRLNDKCWRELQIGGGQDCGHIAIFDKSKLQFPA